MFLAVLLTATIFFEARGAPATTPKDSCVYLIGQTPQLLRQLRNAYQAIIGADGSGVDEDDMPIYPSDVMNELASTSVACDAIKKVLTMNIGILPNVTAAYPDKKSEVDEIGDNLSRLHQNIVNCRDFLKCEDLPHWHQMAENYKEKPMQGFSEMDFVFQSVEKFLVAKDVKNMKTKRKH